MFGEAAADVVALDGDDKTRRDVTVWRASVWMVNLDGDFRELPCRLPVASPPDAAVATSVTMQVRFAELAGDSGVPKEMMAPS